MSKPHLPAKGSLSRRAAVKSLTAAAATALVARRVLAAETAQKLDVRDPAAVALGYVENAAKVDARKYPQYVAGTNCENCLQLQGKPGSEYRPCSLFPGKLVSISGWCTGWTAEM